MKIMDILYLMSKWNLYTIGDVNYYWATNKMNWDEMWKYCRDVLGFDNYKVVTIALNRIEGVIHIVVDKIE